MLKTLILFAHPALEKSRAHKVLVTAAKGLEHVTFNDLYERYPDFHIDVEREKELLTTHDRIVWQHPFYWYSTPAIIKEWFDRVLEYGWAYGRGAHALKGKIAKSVITTGGPLEAYGASGQNNYTVDELLRPIQQTTQLCGMQWEDPLVFYRALQQDAAGLADWTAHYRHWLQSS